MPKRDLDEISDEVRAVAQACLETGDAEILASFRKNFLIDSAAFLGLAPEAQKQHLSGCAVVDRLSPSQADALLHWQDMGQADGVRAHVLRFYESAADMEAKRGVMTYGRVTAQAGGRWYVDADCAVLEKSAADEISRGFTGLREAKHAAHMVAMERLVRDGYVIRPLVEHVSYQCATKVAIKHGMRCDEFMTYPEGAQSIAFSKSLGDGETMRLNINASASGESMTSNVQIVCGGRVQEQEQLGSVAVGDVAKALAGVIRMANLALPELQQSSSSECELVLGM